MAAVADEPLWIIGSDFNLATEAVQEEAAGA